VLEFAVRLTDLGIFQECALSALYLASAAHVHLDTLFELCLRHAQFERLDVIRAIRDDFACPEQLNPPITDDFSEAVCVLYEGICHNKNPSGRASFAERNRLPVASQPSPGTVLANKVLHRHDRAEHFPDRRGFQPERLSILTITMSFNLSGDLFVHRE
jgi:hypothetical protein